VQIGSPSFVARKWCRDLTAAKGTHLAISGLYRGQGSDALRQCPIDLQMFDAGISACFRGSGIRKITPMKTE